MIYKNNKTINEWYFNDAELIKVYKNGAICYYKIVNGSTPHQEPCFAVVNDITQYSDTEFVDVYDKATEKWYKLNNLDQYEQYGIYGSGRTITYYEGKLTIDNGYEYEWDGSEWDNLGEITGGTAPLPDGYTEVEYVGSNGTAYINTGLQLMNSIGTTFLIEGRVWTEYYVTDDGFGYLMSTESTTSPYPGFCWRWNRHHSSVLEFVDNGASAILSTVDKGDGTSGFTVSSNGTSKTNNNIPFSLFAGLNGSSPWRFSKSNYYDELKITKNNQVVADYIPCQRDSDSKYGFYDLVSESFKSSSNSNSLIGGATGGTRTEYPKYYTEKDEPENNVVFEDMEEALAYECPWVGMDATIDNTPYLFGDAYEWLTKYGLFEVSGEYICDSGDKYEKMEEMVRNTDGTWSSQIPAVYEKGDLIEAGSSDCSSRLPDGYTEVEYIENTSSAYINTGFKPNQDTRITCEMQCVTSTNSVLHFGTGGWDKVNGMWLTYETGVNGTLHISWLGKTVWSTYSSVHGDYNRHTYDWNKNNIYKDGVLVASNTYANYSCPDNLAIFTTILNGTSYESSLKMLGRVYWFKIYDNGTLVRDLVPCVRDSDNIAGAYDLVNNVFYGSGNNNRFVAGDPV